MAVFRAYQVTDMRAELWGGIVVARTGTTITATDGFHVSQYGGGFQYPYTGLVSGYYTPVVFFDPLGLGPVAGTVTSYAQTLGFPPQLTIDHFAISAATLFHAIRAGGPQLASALVFAGGDFMLGSRGRDVLLGFAGNDTINGNAGNDALRGDLGADNLYGGAGNDALRGGDGIDRLFGSDGNDRLHGDAGRDFLSGQDGRDRLTGGTGPDRLTGGDDADSFRFVRFADSPAGSDKRDAVTDFTHRTDLIDLRPIDADAEERGNQPFDFIGAAPFTDTPGQLRYTKSSHILAGDTDGDGDADFEVNLANAPTLTADDLLL